MQFGVWLSYFLYQMSSAFCVPRLALLPIELMLPPSMRCVVLCIKTLRWFDYCDCMMYVSVCCLYCLCLSVTLQFWWINVFKTKTQQWNARKNRSWITTKNVQKNEMKLKSEFKKKNWKNENKGKKEMIDKNGTGYKWKCLAAFSLDVSVLPPVYC